MTTQTQQLKEVCALWKREGGKTSYYTGVLKEDEKHIVAFYNLDKKNPKEPDLRVYQQVKKGEKLQGEIMSLWVQLTKNKDKKYLTGVDNANRRLVGFINENPSKLAPTIAIYLQGDMPKQETNVSQAKGQDGLKIGSLKLPF